MKALFAVVSIVLSCGVIAAEKQREPLPIHPRPTATAEETRSAEALLRALPTMTPEAAGTALSQLLKEHDIPRDEPGPWLDLIARVGGPQELGQVLVAVLASIPDDCCEGAAGADFYRELRFTNENATAQAARVLVEAAEKRGVRPVSPYKDGGLHLGWHVYWQGPEGTGPDMLRLAGLYHVTEDYNRVIRNLASPQNHKGAYDAMLFAGDQQAADEAHDLILNSDDALSRRGALLLLARFDPPRALPLVARVLSAPMRAEMLAHLWTNLLVIKPFAELLQKSALPDLPPHVRTAGAEAAHAAGLEPLADRLIAKDFGTSEAQCQTLADEAKAKGDAARGELIFRSLEGNCTSCHAIGGAGPKVGPDLAHVGREKTPSEIISDILAPFRHVAPPYEIIGLRTEEKDLLPGTEQTIPLMQFVLKRDEKHSKGSPAGKPYPGSLMPSGLTDGLTHEEVLDLIAFITRLGAPGGIDSENSHVARHWRVESESRTSPRSFINSKFPTGGTSLVLSLVNGDLRREDCLLSLYDTDQARPFFIGTEFTVAAPGEVHMSFSGIGEAWIDGKRVEGLPGAASAVMLASGVHRVDARLLPESMPERVRIESPDVIFSADPAWTAGQ